jgi:P4 family phage/plasmid primase-like protien
VGVRLGTPSKIDGKYLAVIDVDVKSTDPKHRKEAYDALAPLIGKQKFPTVSSGRGNGSAHFYCLTDFPFKTYNPAASQERIKYLSPSKKPSKEELNEISPEEIKKGYRFSKAWEISLYSDGRQVVLPPSIHPDSGNPYLWKTPFQKAPTVSFDGAERTSRSVQKTNGKLSREKLDSGSSRQRLSGFEATSVQLDFLEIPKDIVTLIKKGIWAGREVDNSDYMPMAITALLSAGCDRNDTLTIMTDPDYALGRASYRHAGETKNREVAANWAWHYGSVKKAMDARDPKKIFSTPFDEELLSKEEQEKQNEDLKDNPRERGFHTQGKNGALFPDYKALLSEFSQSHAFKTIADMKSVFQYNGTHYVDLSKIEIKGFAEDNFRPEPSEKTRTEFYCKVLANNIENRAFFEESTEDKVNFKNGVLDVVTYQLLPHSPEYGFRSTLPYEYIPEARCPEFEKWIHSVMLGDPELIAILQEYMGYIVRGGDYCFHKALWLGGVGRNGKSTFVDVLKMLIGQGNYSVISIKALMADRFSSGELDGKLANFSEETSAHELRDSGTFKNLTGDGEISGQKKFGNLYQYRNKAKLVMTYNQIPNLSDLSRGMMSRPLIVPFKKIIQEKDSDLGLRIRFKKELSGIFNFAWRGWERLEERGAFTKSKQSEYALETVRKESCNVYQWAEDHIVPHLFARHRFPAHQVYEIYRQYERHRPFARSEFFRRLNAHPSVRGKAAHSGNDRFYVGINVIGDNKIMPHAGK